MLYLAQSSGGAWVAGSLFFIVAMLIAVSLYAIPTIIGFYRKVPNLGSLVVVNVFLGWSVVGWVVALAMALRDRAGQVGPKY